MHINVSDILVEAVGYSRNFVIIDERPALEGLILEEPVSGRVSVMRLDAGVAVRGRLATAVQLECDRCLRTFARPVSFDLQQVFTKLPGDDEQPIDHGTIDLAPTVRQEIVLKTPIKLLCRPDCPGLADAQQYAQSLKGTIRGRTQET